MIICSLLHSKFMIELKKTPSYRIRVVGLFFIRANIQNLPKYLVACPKLK